MSAEAPASVGRPRDPAVDERVLRAAVALFGDVGWSGFTFDGIARRASVGKAAIYRRWSSKEELLVDALSHDLNVVEDADTGSLRGDLLSIARQLMASYLGDAGRAFMRLNVESGAAEAIGERYAAWSTSQVRAARATVRRAIARGELSPGAPTTLIMDTLCGGAINHAAATPPHLRDRVRAGADAYAEALVDFVLTAAKAAG
ncbi:TetR/AcrR family transcriptional regulator [Microbacterium sp. No. 7]|uniref:TetR/AcrR family transcriptional regulator n=1 Tax=Microbacterium sp. No. 7 TaxID=1714373 RepID=UPI0006D0C2B9|nr:TetR/AcrR family transcriptional regulator [Microbacterium sp. No. 7]ALJ21724.1 transcriptional regulator [Microbacterium sp. No. 7]